MQAGHALRKPSRNEETPTARTNELVGVATKRSTKERPKPRLFHARMLVTRLEEWCVEASTPQEAEALLAAGGGHRCTPGESIQVEIDQLIDE